MPTDDTKQPVTTPPIVFNEDTPPPMMQGSEPLTVNSEQKKEDILNPSPVTTNGSAAPANDIIMDTVMPTVVTTPPSKKYAGGKIIATILGLFLLVGGVGAGVYLTGQNQNIEEKAALTGDCEKFGSPKARQQCRACKDGDCKVGGPGSKSRCQVLSLCKNINCRWEWEGECSKRDKTTTTVVDASCQSVNVYSSTWVLLTSTQLSALRTGDVINFCVAGTATGGTFTKAMFTINDVVQSETTMQRPSSTDFCQQYTIPAGTTTFNVVGDIFHDVMGWQ